MTTSNKDGPSDQNIMKIDGALIFSSLALGTISYFLLGSLEEFIGVALLIASHELWKHSYRQGKVKK